jgi:hypothetical protein
MIRVLSREPDRSMLGLADVSTSPVACSRALCLCFAESRILNALLEGGSEGGNPARVALKGATENQLLGHDCDMWLEEGSRR